jgi:hypothetical protein
MLRDVPDAEVDDPGARGMAHFGRGAPARPGGVAGKAPWSTAGDLLSRRTSQFCSFTLGTRHGWPVAWASSIACSKACSWGERRRVPVQWLPFPGHALDAAAPRERPIDGGGRSTSLPSAEYS